MIRLILRRHLNVCHLRLHLGDIRHRLRPRRVRHSRKGITLRGLGSTPRPWAGPRPRGFDCLAQAKELNLAALGRLEDAVDCYSEALVPLNHAWQPHGLVKHWLKEKIGRMRDAANSYQRFIDVAAGQDLPTDRICPRTIARTGLRWRRQSKIFRHHLMPPKPYRYPCYKMQPSGLLRAKAFRRPGSPPGSTRLL